MLAYDVMMIMRVLQGNEELLERRGWDVVNSGRGTEERVSLPKL
jgi:hypothetical protein